MKKLIEEITIDDILTFDDNQMENLIKFLVDSTKRERLDYLIYVIDNWNAGLIGDKIEDKKIEKFLSDNRFKDERKLVLSHMDFSNERNQ